MNHEVQPEAFERRLTNLFGAEAHAEHPFTESGLGVRVAGIDLCRPLDAEQVTFLLDALSQFRLVCIAGQDLRRFTLAHFERFANHWGAPIPHPSNFTRGGKPAQGDGATDGAIEFIPWARRKAAAANRTLPGQLQCLPHESPAILVATNLRGEAGGGERVLAGGSWHTDVEYEQLPIYCSMFLAHYAPVSRGAPGGTWVQAPVEEGCAPYFEGSDEALMGLRRSLPLNGETSFADTCAAFSALPPTEQIELERLKVRRRLNEGDEGWLAPLVRTDPRSRLKSLHSPVWASRPGVRPPIEVDGMTMDESRAYLDRLEAHVLQPQFRYDHRHVPGDVTIWNNYMTLHNSPPIKSNIRSADDARLLYRVSCKGEPALVLPRDDDPAWLAAHVVGRYVTPVEVTQLTECPIDTAGHAPRTELELMRKLKP